MVTSRPNLPTSVLYVRKKKLLSYLSYYIWGSFYKNILNYNTILTRLTELSNLKNLDYLGRDRQELNRNSVHIVMDRIEPKLVSETVADGKALPCHPCTPAIGAPGW